ncbi:MAG TPA: hypothetical protein PKE30_12630 [Niabella sp.]|nr:hypothetical protein [Niabella sp.]
MKFGYVIFGALLIAGFISCKKEKTDDSVEGRFQGSWIESSAKKVTLVVTKDPRGDANTPNLFLHLGSTGYPFVYRFNSSGDSIYLSSSEGLNQPYKITFAEKSFTIKKFHSALPDSEQLTFNKID